MNKEFRMRKGDSQSLKRRADQRERAQMIAKRKELEETIVKLERKLDNEKTRWINDNNHLWNVIKFGGQELLDRARRR